MLNVQTKAKTKELPTVESELAALRRGNHHVFNRLYAELAPRVLAYLLRRMPSPTDAEDVLQETFLAAYAGRANYRGTSAPLAWLLGIARRRCAERLRQPVRVVIEIGERESGENLAQQVTTALTVNAALSALPPQFQEALELIVIEQLTYREASALLNIPQGTLKWRVHEATRQLRTQLERNDHV